MLRCSHGFFEKKKKKRRKSLSLIAKFKVDKFRL